MVFRKKAKALTSYYYNCTTSEEEKEKKKTTERIEKTVGSRPKRRKRQDGIRNRDLLGKMSVKNKEERVRANQNLKTLMESDI